MESFPTAPQLKRDPLGARASHNVRTTVRSRVVGSVLALPLILNACQSKAPRRAESSAASPSSTAVATVSAPDTVVVVRYEYRDADGLFDPDGYYLPEDSLRVGQWDLTELELHSIDYY